MRHRLVRDVALVGLLALSCTYKRDQGGGPPAYDAETFEAPPGRQVYGDGLIGAGGTGGAPGNASDAAAVGGAAGSPEAPRPMDAAVPKRDTGVPDTAAPDTASGREAGDNGCDLFLQDCPKGQACYPASGRGLCQLIDLGLSEGVLCGGPGDCDRGLGCFSNVCRRFCDTSAASCPPNSGRCTPLAGFDRAGYCTP